MGVQKNLKSTQQKAVVKHIQYREHVMGKKIHKVRARGHKITQDKLQRWAKANPIDQRVMPANAPSRKFLCQSSILVLLTVVALPSCISICTKSVSEISMGMSSQSSRQSIPSEFSTTNYTASTPLQRLLTYTRLPNHVVEGHGTRAAVNDLQLFLSNEYATENGWNEVRSSDSYRSEIKLAHKFTWNSDMEEIIFQMRNYMNISPVLAVGGESKGM